MKKIILILGLGCFVSVFAQQDEQASPDVAAEGDFNIEMEQPLANPLPSAQEEPINPPAPEPAQEPAQEVMPQETVVEQPVEQPAPEPVAEPAPQSAAPIAESAPALQPEAPDMSAPVESDATVAMPAEGDEEPLPEIEGIDTVDLDSPQGNWLFKRIWWERAEQKYEKIRGIVQSIFESRMGFFSLRNDVDKSVLDPFYIGIGLSQGELQMLLDQLVQTLDKERQDKGTLDANERAALSAILQEGEMIEQMHKDVMAINQLDRDIDDALSQLMEQINRVRGYDSEAWQAFKEIARVLDDTKARELYYQVDTAGRNIKDIKTYIDTSFAPHFEQLVKTVREQVERVQHSAVALKEKGIDLKLQVERITKGSVSRAGEQEEEEEEVSGGFFSSIFSAIGSFFSSIWGIIRWPYDLIFGGGSEVEEDVDTEDVD